MMTHPIGVEALRGGVCGTIGRHDRYAEPVWLSGNCQCLNSLIPTSLNDCRVNDVDDDGMPGLTLSNQVLPGVTAGLDRLQLCADLRRRAGQAQPASRAA